MMLPFVPPAGKSVPEESEKPEVLSRVYVLGVAPPRIVKVQVKRMPSGSCIGVLKLGNMPEIDRKLKARRPEIEG